MTYITNWYILLVAAVIPLFTGAIWYNAKVFGGALKKISGANAEGEKGGHKPIIYILAYVLGLFLAVQMMTITIHQMHVFSLFDGVANAKEPGSDLMILMEKYGHNFRSFGHGAFHGILSSVFFVLPVVGIIALFEKKGGKYIFIHTGYWAITMMLMGGLICHMM